MRNLYIAGITLIFLGFISLFITLFVYSMQHSPSVSGAFVLTIFFIPIVGSFGKYGDLISIFLIILTIILIIITFLPLIFHRSRVEKES
jgi:hypothetical protein